MDNGVDHFIFCPGKLCSQPVIDKLLSDIPLDILDERTRSYLPKSSTTKAGSFAAYIIIGEKIAGFAVGKYSTRPFDSVSSFGLLWDSVLTWIEIFPEYQGKGLCTKFVRFLLEELDREKILFVEINNVGGPVGCRCYLRAITELKGVGGYYDPSRSTFMRFEPEQCRNEHENINLLVLSSAKMFSPQFFS